MKWSGNVGYMIPVEERPGIWKERPVVRKYRGDVVTTGWHLQAAASTLNDNPKPNVQIEVMADAFAWQNFGNIRWIQFNNSKWKVSSIQPRRPRLIINFGEKYNDQYGGAQ
jgi:hypothetical protein